MGSRDVLAPLGALLVFFVGSAAGAVETIDLVGVTSATFQWDPATGPVFGYYVIVSRNGADAELQGFTENTSATIEGEFGDTVVVEVTAFDGTGLPGPISPASDPIRFLATPDGGDPPAGDPPAEDPPADDPPAGDPPAGDPPVGDPPPAGPGVALDFTGDGRSDALVRGPAGELSLWALDGGNVIGTTDFPTLPHSWAIVGNGDYDGNGIADVLWHNGDTGEISVWLIGNGTIIGGDTVNTTHLLAEDEWHVAGSADFDGDGRDDLLMFSRVLGELELIALDGANVSSTTRFAGHTGAWSVAATADCDGDGVAEVIWRDEMMNELSVFKPGTGATMPLGDAPGRRVVGVGDFDGDGSADLLLRETGGTGLEVWYLDASGLTLTAPLPAGPDPGWNVHGAGDYDGNGREDLYWTDVATGAMQLWLNGPAGVSAVAVSAALAPGDSLGTGTRGTDQTDFRRKLCSADVSGDGNVAIVDAAMLSACMGQDGVGSCEPMDLNSDRVISIADYSIMSSLYGGPNCPNGF